jgi:hypothetical protein
MKKSAFSPRARRGFTLVEVALAAVIGTTLLVSLIYTSREMTRAVAAVYNETMLQTVFRDLQNDLDSNIFVGLDGATDDNAYTGGSSPFQFSTNALTITNMNSSAQNFRLSFVPGNPLSATPGGELRYSAANGAANSWRPMASLGSRGMLQAVAFNYSTYTAPLAVPSGAASFTINPSIRNNLFKVDAILNKTDMVPFMLQTAYAPRATSWRFIPYSKQDAPANPRGPGGSFYPMALKRNQIDYTAPFNIFTGAGSGHFGWLSWNGEQSQTTLAENLTDPNSNSYVNPDDPDDHVLNLFDWVNGKVGVVNSNDVRDALAALVGREIDVIAWDNNIGSGSNTYIQAAGFARVKIEAFDLPSKTITATFQGWVDENGELLPPTIISFNPTAGRVGRSVQIIGSNFDPDIADNVVYINGQVAPVTAAATNSLVIEVPPGATTGAIVVENNDLSATSAQQFVVLQPPQISSFSPDTGGPGTSVTIEGQHFDTTPSANVVLFNGIQAVVNSGDATRLVVTVPAGATTGQISVTCNDNQTALSAGNFSVPPPPAITGFSPATATEGQPVTINGSNFDENAAGNQVLLNGVAATITSASANQIMVVVPAGATTGKISVIANGLTSFSTDNFIVRPAPTITSFTPTSGGVNTLVTITGTNFDPDPGDNTVKFNGTAANIVSANATRIVAKVATGSSTGPFTVQVGARVATSPSNFTFTADPIILGFAPTSTYVGQTVTIDGANFDPTPGNNVVKFNGVTATVDTATSTKLEVRVPVGATDGKISVDISGRYAESPGSFNVTTSPAPAISSFEPSSAYTGQNVVIHGANFSSTLADNSVRFNGVLGTVVAATSTQLTVRVPLNALSGPIQVTVNSLTGTSPTNFTYIPPPSIISFNPPATSVGQQVTIQGSGFNPTAGNNLVKFNGTFATVTSASATTLQVLVPNGATDGPITVLANGQETTSTTPFDVTALPAPVIYGFTPAGTWVGNTVTLTGVNFSSTPANNTVRFNGIVASIVSATNNNLVVIVPSGATNGYITVTTNGLVSTSPNSFVVTPAPMPDVTGFSPTTGRAGTVVTITGQHFNPHAAANNVVKFHNGQTATVTAATATTLTVTVPAGAITGPIQVTSWGNTATSAGVFTVKPLSNMLQPIALNASLVAGRANNSPMGTQSSGFGVDRFVWLAWRSTDRNDSALQTSLSTTPNSANYTNPADATDHFIDVGDIVYAMNDTSNQTRNAIDGIKTGGGNVRNLIVPLFDSATINPTPETVRISGFALIQITDRATNGSTDTLTMTFLRLCDSAGN